MSNPYVCPESCEWCGSGKVTTVEQSVFWELPEGTRAIEIIGTPTVSCHGCGMEYQDENLVKIIEDQLFLIDRTKLPPTIRYEDFMNLPRLLKRNYFDFS